MSTELRRSVMSVATLLLLGAGTLAGVEIDSGTSQKVQTFQVLDAATFSAELTGGRIAVAGTSASAQHELRLLQVIAEQFADHDSLLRLTPGIVAPDDWADTSTRLLLAMAAFESASVIMKEQSISFRGITFDSRQAAENLEALRILLPADAILDQDILAIDDRKPLDKLCQSAFADLASRPLAVHQSSADIRTSSYSSLDKIIDFAFSCRQFDIAIIGHSDALGDEQWNRRLSEARAQAVADYLSGAGVAPDRLVVEGRGSLVPVADNETAYGRNRNRRIEFELRRPSL